MHCTPQHCLVHGDFPLFGCKKPCFTWQNGDLLRSPVQKDLVNSMDGCEPPGRASEASEASEALARCSITMGKTAKRIVSLVLVFTFAQPAWQGNSISLGNGHPSYSQQKISNSQTELFFRRPLLVGVVRDPFRPEPTGLPS